MNTATDATLFEELLRVTTVDNAKYDRVARFGMVSDDKEVVLTLDVNIELYPLAVHEAVTLVLASTLALDGTKDDGKGWRNTSGMGDEASLADMFDYVCHGKIYKFEDSEDGQTIKVYISFGGLLMALEGPYKKLTPLRVDHVYMLLKR